MVNKEKLKKAILLAKELNGTLSLMHIPKINLYSTKDLSDLYYEGVKKVETGVYLNGNPNFIQLTNTNLDEVVDKVYVIMQNDIHTHVLQALKNLNWKVEEIKNFEYTPEKYKQFQEEVLKLIEIEIQVEKVLESKKAEEIKTIIPIKIIEEIIVPEVLKSATLINNVKLSNENDSVSMIEKINNLRKTESLTETIRNYQKQVEELRLTLKIAPTPTPVATPVPISVPISVPVPVPVSDKHKIRINELRVTAESLANDFISSMSALETDIKEAIDETPKEVLDDLGYHSVEDVTQDIKLNKSYKK